MTFPLAVSALEVYHPKTGLSELNRCHIQTEAPPASRCPSTLIYEYAAYKAFRAEILKQLHLEETRFSFEPEITAKIAKLPNIRIYGVGISYDGRTYSEGKKIGWKDGIRAFYCIIKQSAVNNG